MNLFRPVKGIEEAIRVQLHDESLDWMQFRTLINFADLYPLLPKPRKGQRIVDVGCGTGRVAIALAKLWNREGDYHLADGAGQTGGFLNDMDVTTRFVSKNIPKTASVAFCKIHDTNKWVYAPKEAGLAISIYAVGKLLPIDTYRDMWHKMLKPGATAIFSYSEQSGPLPGYFSLKRSVPDSWPAVSGEVPDIPCKFVKCEFNP